MKRYYLLNLFLLLTVFFAVFTVQDKVKEITQLQEIKEREVNQLEEELQLLYGQVEDYEDTLGIGGANTFPENLPTENFVFPIAEEDYIRYTSPFGYREDPFTNIQMYHRGVDISTVWRAQVVAVADGVVINHYPPPGTPHPNGSFYRGHPIFGGMIEVEHDGFTTLYAHLSNTSIRTGQSVSAGQFIGRVGNTGYSRGQHLHFEMKINGNNVNPLIYLSELPEFEEN